MLPRPELRACSYHPAFARIARAWLLFLYFPHSADDSRVFGCENLQIPASRRRGCRSKSRDAIDKLRASYASSFRAKRVWLQFQAQTVGRETGPVGTLRVHSEFVQYGERSYKLGPHSMFPRAESPTRYSV